MTECERCSGGMPEKRHGRRGMGIQLIDIAAAQLFAFGVGA